MVHYMTLTFFVLQLHTLSNFFFLMSFTSAFKKAGDTTIRWGYQHRYKTEYQK